ncbi:biliverdin-producing heme oxygenase [Xenophilus sp. Marseille-Q4582]|uniref:biliverdin-producing heme oxygenase n=1 Tax=Xenophilus sp. Marseille-Q4582 TaxID=2866600 RepID=UPI001CE497D9|nr:biliverdin-producing heme oxygenase [Xenophilus sp. Marseille-Q4582]
MALSATASDAAVPAPAVAVRDALRQATSHLHAAVDAGMPLSGPAPSLADYHAHLCLLRDWVRLLQALPGMAERLAAERAALNADIEACERLRGATSPAWAPAAAAAVPLAGSPAQHAARAWGVAYVVEGSRLGGQVLYRRLAAPLAPHPLRYLQGAGAQTGARWRAFLDELRAALDTPARVQAACEGAVWAFERLLQLSRHAAAPGERAA